jgi:hypothetical protein
MKVLCFSTLQLRQMHSTRRHMNVLNVLCFSTIWSTVSEIFGAWHKASTRYATAWEMAQGKHKVLSVAYAADSFHPKSRGKKLSCGRAAHRTPDL